MITLEVCVDTPAGVQTCEAGGADRIELCSALSLGGLTPSPGLMKMAADSSVPAHAMIRPSPGGFAVTQETFDTMLADIWFAREVGLAGVVFGVTTENYELDLKRLKDLRTAAGSMEVTLHRAIDLCKDPLLAVEQAVDLGFTRILTSGSELTAFAGRKTIAEMVNRSAGRIEVMAGSGVSIENAAQIIAETGVRDIHTSCSTMTKEDIKVSDMAFGPVEPKVTDLKKIVAIKNLIKSA